jgi:hypothetical protein
MTMYEVVQWGVGWLAFALAWALVIGVIVMGVFEDHE